VRLVALLTAAACAAACGEAGGVGAGYRVRDSAGVHIVENTTPAEPVWRAVDSTPLLDLGSLEEGHEEFNNIRGVVLLGDGGVVVADGGTGELRIFGADGTWLRTWGRQGGGPGEFEGLVFVEGLPGDTLVAFDFRHRRLSYFSPDSGLVREVSLEPGQGSFPIVAGLLANGQLLVQAVFAVQQGIANGSQHDSALVATYDGSGHLVTTLGRFPNSERMIKITGSASHPTSVEIAIVPFSTQLVTAARDSLAIIANTGDYRLGLYRPNGTLAQEIRRTWIPEPVTDEVISRYLEAMSRRYPPGQEAARDAYVQFLKESPYPSSLPALGGVLVSRDGSLWVEAYRPQGDERPERFSVFDQSGRWVGDVRMPARFTTQTVHPDRVAGVWRDPDDIEHARVYRLIPP
jgi:hypothetical protein